MAQAKTNVEMLQRAARRVSLPNWQRSLQVEFGVAEIRKHKRLHDSMEITEGQQSALVRNETRREIRARLVAWWR